MDTSLDRFSESLNLRQSPKFDDRQPLCGGILPIGTGDNLTSASGSGLSCTVQNAIDNWAGKQAVDLTPMISSTLKRSSATLPGISIVNPQSARLQTAIAPTAIVRALPLTITNTPANLAPKSLAITGIKPSYEVNSKLSIDSGLVADSNGWKDITKIDFWLTNAQGKRIELADANTFITKDATSARFAYSTNLTGIATGNYQLNAIAFDKAGAKSNQFSQSISVIKPVNLAPKSLTITGVKSSYQLNSTLSIDSGLVADSNGWQDISKVDFWLTNAQGKRVELADVSSFTAKDATSAKFGYSTSLSGIAAGEYKLNAVAYDKSNLASNLVTQSLVIEPMVIKPVVITPAVNTIVKSAIDIKIADPFNAFSAQQKQAFDIAVSNWKRIITRDKDISGVFNIVAISSTKDFNGNSYLGTNTGAEAFIDPAINSRSNIANDQVPTASPVDINGVDYDNRINLNYYYLKENPSTTDLVVTLMHEIGHALGLDHDDDKTLMGSVHFQDQRSTLSNSSFAALEKLGYKVDRNAQIKWA